MQLKAFLLHALTPSGRSCWTQRAKHFFPHVQFNLFLFNQTQLKTVPACADAVRQELLHAKSQALISSPTCELIHLV
jgi:hypothetical protein